MESKVIVSMLFGRGGSKGLPGKNIKAILGRKVLEYPLMACKNSKYVDELWCSTDCKNIAAVAESFGAKVVMRPDELCTDESLIHDAITHCAKLIMAKQKVKYFVITLCNAPNLTTHGIDKAIEMLNEHRELDSVISVARYDMYAPERARTLSDKSKLILKPYVSFDKFDHKISCDRSSHHPTFFADGGFTVVRSESLVDISQNTPPFLWMGKNIGYFEQAPGGGDIDYLWQVPMLEQWLRDAGFTETSTPY